jgi:pyrimidine-specific ribonucleoside hydrolase
LYLISTRMASRQTRGESVCDYYGVTGKPPNAEVGVELDGERFFRLLYRLLSSL